MAGTGVGKFSSTASNNTSNLTVNFAENMAPSNVNNAARELMGHMRDMYEQLGDGYFEFGDGDGVYTIARVDADTLTIATAADLSTTYFAGRKIRVTDGGANVLEGTIASTSHGSSLQTVNLTGIDLASGTPTKVELGIDTAAFGGKIILDDDGNTFIEAPTDNTIDIHIAGAKDFVFTANTFTAESGSTIAAQALTATTLTTTGAIAIANDGNIGSAGDADAIAISSSGVVTFSQAPVFPDGSIAVADLDIDGATDIGAAIVDADLFIVDDGAGGTNRKVTASRLKTYVGTFDTDAAVTFNESGNDVDFRIESNGDANCFVVNAGNDNVNIRTGGVNLGGVFNVIGATVIQIDDNSDNLTLTSTDADSNAGPNLRLYRNNDSNGNDDILGQISFDGRNNNSQDVEYAFIRSFAGVITDGSESGVLDFRTIVGGTERNRLSINPTATTFNEEGIDLDFRVESEDEANFFVIDAGNNVAGIGSTGSTIRFNITNASNSNTTLAIQNTASDNASVATGVDCVRAANSAYGFLRLNSSNGADVEFNFRGDGEGFCDGSFSGGGADYAEYFEWKDGNSSDEDRIGYAVILDGTQIVKATDSDDASKIIGVISGNPAMVGDSAWNKWQEKHVTDDWNRYTYEDYTQTEWKDEDDKVVTYQTDLIPADVTVPDDAVVTSKDQNNNNLQRRVVNSNWDSTITYVPRSDRKEWDTVGLMGKLRLRKGQPTGTNWLKMRDISDTVEEWLVR